MESKSEIESPNLSIVREDELHAHEITRSSRVKCKPVYFLPKFTRVI